MLIAQQQKQLSNLNKAMQINNSQNQQGGNNLNIFFIVRRRQSDDDQFAVQIQADQLVSELIKRYRSKSGDYVEKKKFIFNAKALNPTLTCAEAGLTDHSIVQVIDTRDLQGA